MIQKLTGQASKAYRIPFETILTYYETFGRWVPLSNATYGSVSLIGDPNSDCEMVDKRILCSCIAR